MPVTRLYLVRHAQSTWNVEKRWQGQLDPPLSPLGRSQAECTAQALSGVAVSAIYSSPLKRAFDTARAIAGSRGVEVFPVDALREIHVGAWQGLTHQEIEALYPGMLERWRLTPAQTVLPEGEAVSEVTKRGLRAFHEIVERHPRDTVAVVAHEGISRLVLKAMLDGALPEPIRMPNCSISVLEWEGGAVRVVSLNDTSHLRELSPTDH